MSYEDFKKNGRYQDQVEYLDAMGTKPVGLVHQSAFLLGMSEIGYRTPSYALADLIDNSIEAEADKIAVEFLVPPKAKKSDPPQ